MKIIIGYEWKYSKKHWLHEELEKAGYDVIAIGSCRDTDRRKKLKNWHKIFELIDYYQIARKALSYANSGDVFIGWCFTTGVFFSILDKKRKCKIISMNILTQKKESIMGKLRNLLYLKAFKNSLFYATCNTKNGIRIATDIFGSKYENRFFVLHDAMFFNKEERNRFTLHDNYCFSGGASGRDWTTLLKACKLLPDLKFKIIAGTGSWNNYIEKPSNVEVLFDTTEEIFESYLRNAKLVVLPVVSEMTSGLLVLFDAIYNFKPIVASNTEAISNYYSEESKDMLAEIGNEVELAAKIKHYYYNSTLSMVENIYNYNLKNNTLEKYMKTLLHIIETI